MTPANDHVRAEQESDAQPLLLKAAKRLEPLDLSLARETYLDALTAALFAGRLASGETVLETARAARTARASEPPRPPDLLLDGLALVITEGHDAGVPTLRRAVKAVRAENVDTQQGRRRLWLACRSAALLWDSEA